LASTGAPLSHKRALAFGLLKFLSEFFQVFLEHIPLDTLSNPRGWFKGADTTTLLLYLQTTLTSLIPSLSGACKQYFLDMLTLTESANGFMKLLYHCGLWLREGERNDLISWGHELLLSFQKCAQFAYDHGLNRWKLQTKFHYAAEIVFALEHSKHNHVPCLNPLSASTQVDEDFVGRISTMSRGTDARSLHYRTIRKYLLALAAHW
jgi:hypothetical protein